VKVEMVDDISNKTTVVLVILTVIISILGTMVVLSEVSNFKPVTETPAPVRQTTNTGMVSLGIVPQKPTGATGYVTLEIK
jgi:hypothetical protein